MKRIATLLFAAMTALCAASASAQSPGPAQPPPPASAPAVAPIPLERVDQTIASAVRYCLKVQDRRGAWGTKDDFCFTYGDRLPYSSDVFGLFLLAHVDEIPAHHEALKAGLRRVLAYDPDSHLDKVPLSVAFRVLALCRLYPRLDKAQQSAVQQRIKADYDWLLKNREAARGWPGKVGWNSRCDSTCWAVLALSEAEVVLNLRRDDAFWSSLLKYCLDLQYDDGGFPSFFREPGKPSTPQATALTLTALLALREHLTGGQGCLCAKGRIPGLDLAIERSRAWIDAKFDADADKILSGAWNYQVWWCGCQRSMDTLGARRLNGHDWRGEIVWQILRWRVDDYHWGPVENTALEGALLIANRGPCLVSKLQFDGDWSRHPRDLTHLVDYVARASAEHARWQTVDLSDKSIADEWPQAPILYIAPGAKVDLSAEQKKALRQFTARGGTIFVEAGAPGASSNNVRDWCKVLCKEIWPEWQLKDLSADKNHPLWLGEAAIRQPPGGLQGLDDGLRTFLILSTADTSAKWCKGDLKAAQSLFDLGRNLSVYATDRMPLADWARERRDGPDKKYAGAAKSLRAGAKQDITVARVKHGDDWDLDGLYQPWQVLASDLALKMPGLKLREVDPVAVGESIPAGTTVLYLSGRAPCDLGPGAGKWLKDYVSAGGFLFVEAVLGSESFWNTPPQAGKPSLQQMLTAAGLEIKPLDGAFAASGLEPDGLLTGKGFPAASAQGYDLRDVRYTDLKDGFRLAQAAEAAVKEAAPAGDKLLVEAKGAKDASLAALAAKVLKVRDVAKIPAERLPDEVAKASADLGIPDPVPEATRLKEALDKTLADLKAARKEWEDELKRPKTVGQEDQDFQKQKDLWSKLDAAEAAVEKAQAAQVGALGALQAKVVEVAEAALDELAEKGVRAAETKINLVADECLKARRAAAEARAAQGRPCLYGIILPGPVPATAVPPPGTPPQVIKGQLVGLYSPCDIMFSQTGCKAFGNRGYAPADARALAINIVLLLTAR